jgi:hypothetical protein
MGHAGKEGQRYAGKRLLKHEIEAAIFFVNLFLAPHTSAPRDVPRYGALSLLQKTPHYMGDQRNCC